MNAANDEIAGHEAEACAAKPRVRDRIFDTACELFYQPRHPQQWAWMQ